MSYRIFRCGESHFYHDEILKSSGVITDDHLESIAAGGFNGIWLRGRLRELVPGRLFESYVEDVPARKDALADLCNRAGRYGLGVWLLFEEPLGLEEDHPFWSEHPELAGQKTWLKGIEEKPKLALCTSMEETKSFLREGYSELLESVPLAGVLLITASEEITHCWAHVQTNPDFAAPEPFWSAACHCPRCGKRNGADVMGEIIGIVAEAARENRPETKVVAWDWSWNMNLQPPYEDFISSLPEKVAVMSDFERGGTVERLGRELTLEEYSLIYSGPSPRFQEELKVVDGSRDFFAKLQINSTHEIATVPNMPLVGSLYRKSAFMRDRGVENFLGTWNICCEPDTLNTFAFIRFLTKESLGRESEELLDLAEVYFGQGVDAEKVVEAWKAFELAGEHFPLGDNRFVYYSPVNYALSYPLKEVLADRPMGPSWINHEWGDRLEDSVSCYTLEEVTPMLDSLWQGWRKGCNLLEQALDSAVEKKRVRLEMSTVTAIECSYHSTANIYKWYLRRRKETPLGPEDESIVEDEIANLRRVLPWVESDSRLGLHEEWKWRGFTTESLHAKLGQLQALAQLCRVSD